MARRRGRPLPPGFPHGGRLAHHTVPRRGPRPTGITITGWSGRPSGSVRFSGGSVATTRFEARSFEATRNRPPSYGAATNAPSVGGLLAHGLIGLVVGLVVLVLGYELFRAWLAGPDATAAQPQDGARADALPQAVVDRPCPRRRRARRDDRLSRPGSGPPTASAETVAILTQINATPVSRACGEHTRATVRKEASELPAEAAWLRKPYAAADLARALRQALDQGRGGASAAQ